MLRRLKFRGRREFNLIRSSLPVFHEFAGLRRNERVEANPIGKLEERSLRLFCGMT